MIKSGDAAAIGDSIVRVSFWSSVMLGVGDDIGTRRRVIVVLCDAIQPRLYDSGAGEMPVNTLFSSPRAQVAHPRALESQLKFTRGCPITASFAGVSNFACAATILAGGPELPVAGNSRASARQLGKQVTFEVGKSRSPAG
jgi:hypothetical protein